MKFPNKINRYKTTCLYAMVICLEHLEKPKEPSALLHELTDLLSLNDVLDGLTSLFALGTIEMQKGEVMKCLKK
jgi:hypothetical protein